MDAPVVYRSARISVEGVHLDADGGLPVPALAVVFQTYPVADPDAGRSSRSNSWIRAALSEALENSIPRSSPVPCAAHRSQEREIDPAIVVHHSELPQRMADHIQAVVAPHGRNTHALRREVVSGFLTVRARASAQQRELEQRPAGKHRPLRHYRPKNRKFGTR